MHIPSPSRKYMNGFGHLSDGSVKTHMTLTLYVKGIHLGTFLRFVDFIYLCSIK